MTYLLAIALLVAACATPRATPNGVGMSGTAPGNGASQSGQLGAPLKSVPSLWQGTVTASPAGLGGAPLPAVTLDDRTAERRVWLLGQLVATSTSTPDGAIGSALLGGWATWYRDPSQPTDGLYAAAGPALREALGNWRGTVLRVQSGRRWTMARLVDACWCIDRRGRPTLVDLSPAAMVALEPDYRRLGIIAVSIELPTGELPETDQ